MSNTQGPIAAAVDQCIHYAPGRLHADREAFGQIREIAVRFDAERAELLNAPTVLEQVANARGIPTDAARAVIARATGEKR